MQTVYWDDDTVPPLIALQDGDTQFFDRPNWYGFAQGDQIIYMTEIGPSVYRVVDVQPEHDAEADYYGDHTQELRRVTIQGV